jgi:DNA mismatch endonuclease (patch repair protein)
MSDHLTPDQRHKNMAAIRAKDTKPELIVRKYLWSHGFRYRLNHPHLPGKPDIVLRKYRTCIFVNGCFWHKHEGCKYFVIPKTRTEFWLNKVNRNQERDIEVKKKLASMGWHSITIWECELKPNKKDETLQSLVYTLSKIFLQDHRVKRYELLEEETPMMVADNNENEYGKT